MSDALRPCPFCGSTTALEIVGPFEDGEGSSKQRYVVCNFNKDGCGAAGGIRDNEKDAIAAWNRRGQNGRHTRS